MKFMPFREWIKLREVGTATNSIAVFARPVMMSRRCDFLGGIPPDHEDFKKHGSKSKKKKK